MCHQQQVPAGRTTSDVASFIDTSMYDILFTPISSYLILSQPISTYLWPLGLAIAGEL